jgi:hypothetical protein
VDNSGLYEVEIFIAGTRPASNGVLTTISPNNLQEVVDTYNPNFFRAPLLVSETVGHDIGNYSDTEVSKSKELCHGIPKKLKRVGSKLYAQFDKVSRNFSQWVRDRQIHSVSSSFYLPNSPNNPYPGQWSLRHIAGLGSTPPACKGLAPLPEPPSDWEEFEEYSISFSDYENEGIADFCSCKNMIMNSPWSVAADLFQKYREYLIESEDVETADRVLPSDQISAIRMMADLDTDKQRQIIDLQMQVAQLQSVDRSEDEDEEDYRYSYGEMMDYKAAMKDAGVKVTDAAMETGLSEDEINVILSGEKAPSAKQKKALDGYLKSLKEDVEMSEELLAREAELVAREDAIYARERALEYQEVSSFVEGLVAQGKVKAVKKGDTVTLLLNTPNNAEVEFSQSTGKKTPRQALMADFSDRPVWNFNGTVVQDDQDPVNPDFSEVSGVKGATSESVLQHQAVVGWCRKNNKDHMKAADYSEAMLALNISY